MAKKKKKRGLSSLNIQIQMGGTTAEDKAILAKNLAVMQRSGLTISDSLEILQDSVRGRMKGVLKGILKSVRSGNALSESFARYPKVFSGVFISAIYAGEASGTLDENLEILAEQLKKDKELRDKIKGAMIYPTVVLIAAFILGIAMSFFVLPKIIPLFEGLRTGLPLTTRLLIKFSHFVDEYRNILLIVIVAIAAMFGWIVRQKFSHPVTHWFIIHLPIVKKISLASNLNKFARTLGLLLKSGLNIDEALEVTHKTMNNYYYNKALKRVFVGVGKGSKVADNLEKFPYLFPMLVTKMVKVGEESGKLDQTLLYVADFYETEVDNSTKALSTSIEPVLLVIMGIIVAFLALSIITPIYDITGNIQR